MDVAVVGSGIAGSFGALLLARRGHRVTLVDRDPGPVDGLPWERVGVMQFHQPHSWRGPVRNALARHLPDVLRAVEDAGAVSVTRPGMPDPATMLLCRREVLERVLWDAATREPGVTRVVGHADGVRVEERRARGVVVDGRPYAATLVVDATGRASRLGRAYRGPAEGGSCGMDYTSQLFRLRDGAEPGPSNSPVGYQSFHRGYQPIVFVHDAGHFSVLVIRPSKDKELGLLRDPAAFRAAARAVPLMREWVDPARAEPVGPVRTGGGLSNQFQGQPELPGLVSIGDALATTNPNGARGASLAADGAIALAALVDEHPGDPGAWRDAMTEWSTREVRPWWRDHVAIDESLHRRWSGVPPDPDGFISSDLVGEAVPDNPELGVSCGPYFAMLAGPASIDPAREQVRELVRAGWQPGFPDGPTRDELVALMAAAQAAT